VPVGATTTLVAIGPSNGPLISAEVPPAAGNQAIVQASPVTDASPTAHVVIGLRAGPTGPAVQSTTELTILLNPKVSWTIALTGGASRISVNALGGHIRTVELGRASKATVALPSAAGVTTIDEVGGVSELAITAEPGEVASVTAHAGAGTIDLDGVTHTGVGAGTTFSQPGYQHAPNQLAVHLLAGASLVTVSAH
jgi:hypothetical protein